MRTRTGDLDASIDVVALGSALYGKEGKGITSPSQLRIIALVGISAAEKIGQLLFRAIPHLGILIIQRHLDQLGGAVGSADRPESDNGVLPQATDADATQKLNKWVQTRIDAGIAAPGEGLNVWPMVADYNSVDRYRRLASDLQKRGWSQARLEKLFGGNFLRVYRDAWGG